MTIVPLLTSFVSLSTIFPVISCAGMCVCFTIWTAAQATFVKGTEQVPPIQNHAAGNAVIAFIFREFPILRVRLSQTFNVSFS